MKVYPRNEALEAAVIHDADSDTPRLVYADWLQEHGDPNRAEFIRTQCRLDKLTPYEDDWIDLSERHEVLLDIMGGRPDFGHPYKSPAGEFVFRCTSRWNLNWNYRRGFPSVGDMCYSREQIGRVNFFDVYPRFLADIQRVSTIREFSLASYNGVPWADWGDVDRYPELFTAPGFDRIRGLTVSRLYRRDHTYANEYLVEGLVAGGSNLRRLDLSSVPIHVLWDWLGRTNNPAVRELTIDTMDAEPRPRPSLGDCPLPELRRLSVNGVDNTNLTAILRTDPPLETLAIRSSVKNGTILPPPDEFCANQLRQLSLQWYDVPDDSSDYAKAVRLELPALRAFEISGPGLPPDIVRRLSQADWFGRLQSLRLTGCVINDTLMKLIAKKVGRELRVLILDVANPTSYTIELRRFRQHPMMTLDGFAALGQLFPNLTTLDLRGRQLQPNPGMAAMARVLSTFQATRLRSLSLAGWPIGRRGAVAIANNPSFANLERLDLSSCRIGDAGLVAILNSPYLTKLQSLNEACNKIQTGEMVRSRDLPPALDVIDLQWNSLTAKEYEPVPWLSHDQLKGASIPVLLTRSLGACGSPIPSGVTHDWII